MKQLYNNLWQTQVWHPFPNVNTHAYFLRCAKDNVLFYHRLRSSTWLSWAASSTNI